MLRYAILNAWTHDKQMPDALLVFLTEYNNAKQHIKGSLELPINHAQLEYNKQNDIVYEMCIRDSLYIALMDMDLVA